MNPAVEATVEHLSTDGRGIVRVDGQVYFVSGVLPGDRVLLDLNATTKPQSAVAIQLLAPSPHRVPHLCPHFGPCCGSVWGCLEYGEQLRVKQELVERTLRKSIGPVEVMPTVPSPQPWHYRNRITLSVWLDNDRLHLGFQTEARQPNGIPVSVCHLADAAISDCLHNLSSFFSNTELPDIPVPRRVQIHLTTGGAGLLLVFATEINQSVADQWIKLLSAIEISGGIYLASGTRAGILDYRKPLFHSADALPLTTTWLGHAVELDPSAFCQTNPLAADLVGQRLQAFASESHFQSIWDLYGGFGALSLAASSGEERVAVFEISPHAESAMNHLAASMNHPTPDFIRGDLLKTFPLHANELTADDLLILDPPRSGAHPEILKLIASSRIKHVVYLSCNPARLARDLQILQPAQFAPLSIQPYDFFPQTPSIETLAILHRA
jgi:23S rRNA (uracil1939-C5)-methyltransferase